MKWSLYKKDYFLKDIEIISVILLSVVVFACYGMVAEIASKMGVNYTPILVTEFDKNIPFTNIWGLFYEGAFYVPAVVFLLLRWRFGPNVALFQRMCLSVISMMLISFVVFILFPTNSSNILGVPHLKPDSFANSVVIFIYRSIEGWNSTPSTHISMSWLFFRFFARYFHLFWQRLIYLIWFVGMALGTVTLRVHIVLDICTGFLLAEICYQIIYKKLAPGVVSDMNRHFSIKQEIAFAGIITAGLAIALFWFVHKYGIHPILP